MQEQIDGFLAYLELERGLSPTTLVSYAYDLKLFGAYLKSRRVSNSVNASSQRLDSQSC